MSSFGRKANVWKQSIVSCESNPIMRKYSERYIKITYDLL